jgi:DNA-directed RNA polymerase subunit H (RpoH/RPB5)
MSQTLYRVYKNIFLLALKYRGYEKIDEELERDIFMLQIRQVGYVITKFKDPENFRPVYFILISETSNLSSKSAELRALIDSFKDPCDLIILMKKKLKQNIDSVLVPRKHLNITVFLQKHLIIEMPKAPLCGRSRILSREEFLRLANNDLGVQLTDLPIIRAEDPQCMWINAKVGDVVEITMDSDISGETVHYRVVTASSVRRMRSDANERKRNEEGVDDGDLEDESDDYQSDEEEEDVSDDSDLERLEEFREELNEDLSDLEEENAAKKKLVKKKKRKKARDYDSESEDEDSE